MFSTLLWNTLVLTGISIAIFSSVLLVGLLVQSIYSRVTSIEIEKEKINTGFFAALPFGLAAIVLGFLSGLSYEPAISALITGIISLISGAAFIVFHKDIKILVPVGIVVVVFALNLLAGSTLGTGVRDEAIFKTEDDKVNSLLEQSRVEFRVNNYRSNLGLPAIKLVSSEQSEENPNNQINNNGSR